jgi:hypothetical protein
VIYRELKMASTFIFSILQIPYLASYYLWMAHMLLHAKKWQQPCPVQRLQLIRGFNNALKLLWLRFVLDP